MACKRVSPHDFKSPAGAGAGIRRNLTAQVSLLHSVLGAWGRARTRQRYFQIVHVHIQEDSEVADSSTAVTDAALKAFQSARGDPLLRSEHYAVTDPAPLGQHLAQAPTAAPVPHTELLTLVRSRSRASNCTQNSPRHGSQD
jgi:hypothetical protein